MPRKTYKPEEIITRLSKAEVRAFDIYKGVGHRMFNIEVAFGAKLAIGVTCVRHHNPFSRLLAVELILVNDAGDEA